MEAKKTILVVDDEESIRLYTKHALENEGYQVETAGNSSEAMEKVSQGLPDLIVLDISMPGLDGLQFCQVLKDDEKTKQIPVIMLTAKEARPYKFKGEISGADEYIGKSEDFSELIKKVKEHI